MKKFASVTIGAIALLLVCAGTVCAESTLQINGGAGDPNLISGSSFNVLQNSGGAGTIANLILLFSVPGVTSSGTGGISVSSASGGGSIGTAFLAGILATSASCIGGGKDVYSCADFPHINDSNSLGNFNGAESANNGFTATSYGIYQVTITGANLGAKGSTTITGSFPLGTFVDAFGTDGEQNFGTPFTEAGLTTSGGGGGPPPIPEPGTLALFGSGLLGIAASIRRRLSG